MDQSKELMDYLHKRLLPPQRQTYDRGGAYAQVRPDAALLNARL